VRKFRPATKETRFFVRQLTGKPIINVQKELDALQKEYHLPFLCNQNAGTSSRR